VTFKLNIGITPAETITLLTEVAKRIEPNNKGRNQKEYFPVVAHRLNMKINITHKFTSMVTGHGNIRSYLH